MTHESDAEFVPARPSHVVGRRVKQLRQAQGWTSKQLAEHTAAGDHLSWNAVRNIEATPSSRDRDVTIDEACALARALDVPLVWLLADPEMDYPHPIDRDVTTDPWSALLWMTGIQQLNNTPGRPGLQWADAAGALSLAWESATLINQLRERQDHREALAALGEDTDTEQADKEDHALLHRLARTLQQLRDDGMPMPPAPKDVTARARELDITLTGRKRTTRR